MRHGNSDVLGIYKMRNILQALPANDPASITAAVFSYRFTPKLNQEIIPILPPRTFLKSASPNYARNC